MGPRSPVAGSAHSSQIEMPRSWSQRTLVSPRRNHSSSPTIERRCSFFVVMAGKPSARSKRIWWPNTLSVPVPVRSDFSWPWVRTWSRRSRYCRTLRSLTRQGDAAEDRPRCVSPPEDREDVVDHDGRPEETLEHGEQVLPHAV